jgi:UDP-glucuronate decarboxylase
MHPEDGRVVSNFVMAALTGNPITLYGDGSQTRSFCYVDDLIDGLISMMESDASITGPINLGNPGEFTVKELAEMIVKKVPTTSEMVFRPLPQDDPVRRQPDITRAKNQLGWEPTISLDEGLDQTIAYFRQIAAAE